MLSVEVSHIPSQTSTDDSKLQSPKDIIVEMMSSHGYLFYRHVGEDLLFIHHSVSKKVK